MKTIKDLKDFDKSFIEEELLQQMNDLIYVSYLFRLGQMFSLILFSVLAITLYLLDVKNVFLIFLCVVIVIIGYVIFIRKNPINKKINSILNNNEHKQLSDEEIKNFTIDSIKNNVCLSWLDILISNKIKNGELKELSFVKISKIIKVKKYTFSEIINEKMYAYVLMQMCLGQVIQNMVFDNKKNYLNKEINLINGGESFLFYRNIYDGYLYMLHDIQVKNFEKIEADFKEKVIENFGNILEVDLRNSENEDKASKKESIENVIDEIRDLPAKIRESEMLTQLESMNLKKGEEKKKKI